jgi:hypothetical protein
VYRLYIVFTWVLIFMFVCEIRVYGVCTCGLLYVELDVNISRVLYII